MDIKQLRALLAISETGSVSRGGGNPLDVTVSSSMPAAMSLDKTLASFGLRGFFSIDICGTAALAFFIGRYPPYLLLKNEFPLR